jgi:hypothetical protein
LPGGQIVVEGRDPVQLILTFLSVIAAAYRRARSASFRRSASVDMVLGMMSAIRAVALRLGQRGEDRLVVIGVDLVASARSNWLAWIAQNRAVALYLGIFFRHVLRYPADGEAVAAIGQARKGEQMSTLDDIAKERQLIAERLAKLDGDRAKLAEQLAELEAAERVFSRFTQTKPRPGRRGRRAAAAATAAAAEPRRGRRAATTAAAAAAPRRGRRRRAAAPKAAADAAAPRAAARATTRAAPRAARAGGVSLGDATLRAVTEHGQGISAEDVRKYIADQLGIQVRPNHLGMALQRHLRAGRLEQRDLLWFPRPSAGPEAVAS